MENAVKERLRQYLKENEISVNSISKNTGYPQSTLNKQINKETAMSLSTLIVVLDYLPKLSADWLFRGNVENESSNVILLKEEIKKLTIENNILREIVGVKQEQNRNAG